MTTHETLSLLTAVLAAVIAFVALYRTNRIARRQIELQEIQANFSKFQHELLAAKNRADVRASFQREGRDEAIVFRNLGHADALEVQLSVGVPGAESPLIKNEVEVLFPIPRLRPGEEVKMRVAITLATTHTLPIAISWREEGMEVMRVAEFRLNFS